MFCDHTPGLYDPFTSSSVIGKYIGVTSLGYVWPNNAFAGLLSFELLPHPPDDFIHWRTSHPSLVGEADSKVLLENTALGSEPVVASVRRIVAPTSNVLSEMLYRPEDVRIMLMAPENAPKVLVPEAPVQT